MNIFITGGAGFIGSNCTAYFLKKGHSVVVFDNFSRPGSVSNREWLKTLGGKLTVIVGDVRQNSDIHALDEYFSNADAIFHLAGQVAVTSSVQNPREDFDINTLGTLNILEQARLTRTKAKIIYASTNKVYGAMEDVEVSQKETRYSYKNLPYGVPENQALDFHSPYGCSKGAAEQYVHDYARIYDLDTVVFRQSCIYGPRQFGMEDQGWVAWFIIAIILGKKLSIYGNGKQVRDLLFIDDLVRAYEMALDPITRGKIYNIGGGAEHTLSVWSEFGPLLEKLFEKKIPIDFHDWRPGDQKIFVADIRKAESEIGWKPAIGVQQGIEKLYSWALENKTLFE